MNTKKFMVYMAYKAWCMRIGFIPVTYAEFWLKDA